MSQELVAQISAQKLERSEGLIKAVSEAASERPYFDIWRLLADPRQTNEARIRALCQAAPAGANTALCRVLGRHKMFVDTRDIGISTHLMLDGFWEMWVTEAMLRAVRRGSTVLDIGANLGYYSILMADLVGPEGTVIAFEPNPAMTGLLRKSVDVNGMGAIVKIHDVALGAASGSAVLNARIDHPGGAHIARDKGDASSIHVSVRRLDEFEEAAAAEFIKMDVEAFEPQVWSGMSKILQRAQPLTVFMEFSPSRLASADAFLREIAQWDFSVSILEYTGFPRPVSIDEAIAVSAGTDQMLVLKR
jgi:FkbM family methyltransferase